jgi:hypothetical protein
LSYVEKPTDQLYILVIVKIVGFFRYMTLQLSHFWDTPLQFTILETCHYNLLKVSKPIDVFFKKRYNLNHAIMTLINWRYAILTHMSVTVVVPTCQ